MSTQPPPPLFVTSSLLPGYKKSPRIDELMAAKIILRLHLPSLLTSIRKSSLYLSVTNFVEQVVSMAPAILRTTGEIMAKPGVFQQRAYVTFLAGDGDYWKGVVGLAKGLRKSGSPYPLVVAVLPDVPADHRRILRSQGCIVREIDPVYPPDNQTHFAMAYYVINYSKLRIWQFVEYSKMVYLDADIEVFENIDELFHLPDGKFYAVMDCFCEKTWSHTLQHKVGYCQQRPESPSWPAEIGEPPALYFNAGMFVFEPSIATSERLLASLKVTPATPFAEQDFLNVFFGDVYEPIPVVYNLVLAMLWRHPERVEVEKVKVVHYCAAGAKPWRFTGKEENMDREDIRVLVKKWQEIFDEEDLDYKGLPPPSPAEMEVAARVRAALSEAGVAHCVTAPSAA